MLKNKIGKIPDFICIVQAFKALFDLIPDLIDGKVPIHDVKVKNCRRWTVMLTIKNT
jgi:hypothetical protein